MTPHTQLSAALLLTTVIGASASAATTTFSAGAEGWSGPTGPGGGTSIDPAGGNPGPCMHTVFNDFGITFRNSTNPDFVQDLSSYSSVTVSIDVKVDLINFFGQDVSRPWLVEFRDFDNNSPYPWDSVWFKFADISAVQHGEWTTFSVTFDPTQEELPPGWGGYGAEDPETFEPLLPKDRTFADVLATFDELAFTTLEPGFFFSFTDFDLRIDNVTLEGSANCPADITGPKGSSDGAVDALDFLELIAQWGTPCAGPCTADITGPDGNPDGNVDSLDFLDLIAQWGSPGNCPTP